MSSTNNIRELLTRCHFPESKKLDCAVSGGADSLALMVLATHTGKHVTAYHVDHGLRAGSASEFTVVEQACNQFGAESISLRVAVEPGSNLEARARLARYGVLPAGVLTGHTADDQAETLLINLLRGAGTDGLSAMRPDSRPILALRRHETHALCDQLGLSPIVDSSNDDPKFLRNRVRKELVPLMNNFAARDVVPVLARQALVMHDDTDVLNELAGALDPTDVMALRQARPAIARRALREWLRAAGGPERHPPSQAAIARTWDVVTGAAVACDIANGFEVRRRAQRLQLRKRPLQ